MIREKVIIPDIQFYFLFIGHFFGSYLVLSVSEYLTMPNTWIISIFALLIGFLLTFIYSSLATHYKTYSLIEINKIIYGKYIGTIISSIYIIYLIMLSSLNIRYFGDFFVTLIMPETPLIVFAIMLTFVCASAVKKGIEVLSRTAFILILITMIQMLLSSLMLLKEFDLSNFLPILDISFSDFIFSTSFLAFAYYGETISFLLIYPYLSNQSSRYKCTFLPLSVGGLFIVLVSLTNTAVLGKTGSLYTYPTFQAVRLINIGELFTRLELFIFITIILSSFVRASIIYYATTISIAKIFNLKSFEHLVYPLGIIFICLSTIIFEYYGEQMNFGIIVFPIMVFPLHFLIPLLSLSITKIKKLKRS